MRVQLTRRLATVIDGVDLSAHQVGDVFEVTRHEAELLIAEEWAVPIVPSRSIVCPTTVSAGAKASRHYRRRVAATKPFDELRVRAHQQHLGEQEQRRTEDRIREELRDSRAITISKPIG